MEPFSQLNRIVGEGIDFPYISMYTINSRFEWDSAKARRNALKHGVDFKEAATAFYDPQAMVADDMAHSQYEQRRWLIGESMSGRVLVVIFCMRSGPAIRIISARPAGSKERLHYEQNKGIPI